MDLINMTLEYSNAMLVAVMPHISQFVAKANLPLAVPVPLTAVTQAVISPYLQMPGMAVVLTNGWCFCWDHRGFINGWHTPDDWYAADADIFEFNRYVGPNHMTTNEAIALARQTAVRLGYGRYVTEAPELEGPEVLKPFGQTNTFNLPFCRVSWKWPKDDPYRQVSLAVNLNTRQLVEMIFILDRFRGDVFEFDPLKPSVVPELEKDYRARLRSNRRP